MLLVGLPLIASVLGIVLVVFWTYYGAIVLILGPGLSAVNYRRLKSTSRPSR
jgi:hypothetical protein